MSQILGNSGQGGISPEQQSLANFTFGQNALQNAQSFSSMPMSTGHTMADAGAYMGKALNESQMSMADTAAMQNFQTQQKAQTSQQIGNLGSLLGGGGLFG
jgi:hypothetical protein